MTLSPNPRQEIMSSIVEVEELGRRIRQMRMDRRLTLKQIEARSGLSATHISEIERGRTSPTVGALVRIARALGKDASYFIEAEERAEIDHGLRESSRALQRGFEPLSRGIPGSALFSYRITLHGNEFRLAPQISDGDAIYYVIRGSARGSIGGHPVALEAGDAVHASLLHSHELQCTSPDPCEIVLIASSQVAP